MLRALRSFGLSAVMPAQTGIPVALRAAAAEVVGLGGDAEGLIYYLKIYGAAIGFKSSASSTSYHELNTDTGLPSTE